MSITEDAPNVRYIQFKRKKKYLKNGHGNQKIIHQISYGPFDHQSFWCWLLFTLYFLLFLKVLIFSQTITWNQSLELLIEFWLEDW